VEEDDDGLALPAADAPGSEQAARPSRVVAARATLTPDVNVVNVFLDIILPLEIVDSVLVPATIRPGRMPVKRR
jgi:hypothetical protein